MMEMALPVSVQPLIEAYVQALEPLRPRFYGVYVYGSIALGAFEELASDIDVLALTRGEWSPPELKQLEMLHQRLIRAYPLGRRLEVFYIPERYLGVAQPDTLKGTLAPYPAFHDGRLSPATREGLNAVTWWILQHHGLRLLGPERAALPLDVAWADVLATMRYNLEVYYARKLKRPHVYWFDAGVEFGVSNLCRVLTTIEDGEIVSKSAALKRWRSRLPERWQPLLDEAWRLRHHPRQPALYRQRWRRMQETLAFISYGQGRGCRALEVLSARR
jgi:predicted nucleotidyltransferase